MIVKNIKIFTNLTLLVILVSSFFSCNSTDLYETYQEFMPDNVVGVSAPRPTVFLGDEKVVMVVEISADPKLKRGVVTSIFGDVKYAFDINRTIYEPQLILLEFEAEEGVENLIVHLEDENGVKSLKVEFSAEVLGENHRSSLSNRDIDAMAVNSESELVINWASNSRPTNFNGEIVDVIQEPLLVETTFKYTDSIGAEQTIVLDSTENVTTIVDFQPGGAYSYTSTYKAFEENNPLLESYQFSIIPDFFITNAIEGTFP